MLRINTELLICANQLGDKSIAAIADVFPKRKGKSKNHLLNTK